MRSSTTIAALFFPQSNRGGGVSKMEHICRGSEEGQNTQINSIMSVSIDSLQCVTDPNSFVPVLCPSFVDVSQQRRVASQCVTQCPAIQHSILWQCVPVPDKVVAYTTIAKRPWCMATTMTTIATRKKLVPVIGLDSTEIWHGELPQATAVCRHGHWSNIPTNEYRKTE